MVPVAFITAETAKVIGGAKAMAKAPVLVPIMETACVTPTVVTSWVAVVTDVAIKTIPGMAGVLVTAKATD